MSDNGLTETGHKKTFYQKNLIEKWQSKIQSKEISIEKFPKIFDFWENTVFNLALFEMINWDAQEPLLNFESNISESRI